MAEFKVGDKVRVLAGGEGVITYGPVNSTFDTYKMYVVKQDGDDERAFKSVDLEPLPEFAVGDKVTSTAAFAGVAGNLVAGPFASAYGGSPFWVMELDGVHHAPAESSLIKVEAPALVPVGTRVRIDRATYADRCHGRTGTVTSNTETWRESNGDTHVYCVQISDDVDDCVYVAEVTPVDEPADDAWTYKGVTYVPGVDYLDNNGDLWRFALIDGVLHGDWGRSRYSVSADAFDISGAVLNYGPFVKQ
ncbi:hypothetical protein CP967_31305 [Streptomyces nitrosporeus]|uniref:Uncharacterized protein n=1 Tax=Streptomyces nitrosporeus TaxID=28894 RepID=A0A5J6FJ62_9ACTN|nr:hypothetical protein [Streptomyces nitrosporeus]QEU75857.1 hypothetical protein CP967_31305 [Streptomyces nitrosporeus]GGY88853.1 hypothetical protein GCM10010327_19490 [Streptomyces nitrosporeus]